LHVSSIFFLLPPMHSAFCCTAFFRSKKTHLKKRSEKRI
jgi:hypothetical protein